MHCGGWGFQGTTATAHGVVRAMAKPRRAKQWWRRPAATTSTPSLRRPSRSDIAPLGACGARWQLRTNRPRGETRLPKKRARQYG